MVYPLQLTCKDVAAMVVAMQDRKLGVRDRAALRVHMMICEACPRFEAQFLTLKSAMRQWRNYGGDEGSEAAKSAK